MSAHQHQECTGSFSLFQCSLICLLSLLCSATSCDPPRILLPKDSPTDTAQEADTAAQDLDADGWSPPQDCDDSNPAAHPGQTEVCNGFDDDCDGQIDPEWDLDGDGVSTCMGDCDDLDYYRSPSVPERCDGQDNDCDEQVDEDFDLDADGWSSCRGDCDDNNAKIHPGAPELCNGVDDDCQDSTVEDADLDGDGLSLCKGDCDDSDANNQPGGVETCDGRDNDCDDLVDEDLGSACISGCYELAGTDFWACTEYLGWADAEAFCVAQGGHLAHPQDIHQDLALGEAAWAWLGVYFWIGLYEIEREGIWRWSDGSVVEYTAWAHGEPNDYGGNEDCACDAWSGYATWNDMVCTDALPFVCELP